MLYQKIFTNINNKSDFLIGRMCSTDNDGYQIFSVFVRILNSLILSNHKKVTNWIFTGIYPQKLELFEPTRAPMMYNLANGRI